MKDSKSKHPASGETPCTQSQTPIAVAQGSSKLGASLVLGIWDVLLGAPASVFAQSFSIGWHTLDGGGGTSPGGVFSVSGTIGQPDAGAAMAGGGFSLTGDFWSVVSAVQTPDAPTLTITRALANTREVSWPLAFSHWALEWAEDWKEGATWNEITPPHQTNATECYYSPPSPWGSRFYRLRKPATTTP